MQERPAARVISVLVFLMLSVAGYGAAAAGEKGPETSVKGFLNAAFSLKADAAAAFWIAEKRDDVRTIIHSALPGTQISFSGLKLETSTQTARTAAVAAYYMMRAKRKGKFTTRSLDHLAVLYLKKEKTAWLITGPNAWGFTDPWNMPQDASAGDIKAAKQILLNASRAIKEQDAETLRSLSSRNVRKRTNDALPDVKSPRLGTMADALLKAKLMNGDPDLITFEVTVNGQAIPVNLVNEEGGWKIDE